MLHITLMGMTYAEQHGSKYFTSKPRPPTWECSHKVKIQLFQDMVMLHIKLIQQHGSKYHTRNHPPPPRRRGWGQKVKVQLFQNMVRFHIKLNGITNAANILLADPTPASLSLHTPSTRGVEVKR